MKFISRLSAALFALAMMAPPAAAQPAPVFNWSGFYVGAQVGYGWGDTQHFDDGNALEKFNIDGVAAGGTVGFNWHVAPNWLVGIEGDLSFARIRGADDAAFIGGLGTCNCITDVKWFGTARLRTGALVGKSFFYVTGGVAYGELFVQFDDSTPGDTVRRAGWTAGAGWEYALAPNWSTKLEYLYVDFGTFRYLEDPTNIDEATARFHKIRFGVNYRFASGPR